MKVIFSTLVLWLCILKNTSAQSNHYIDSLQHAVDITRTDSNKVKTAMLLFNLVVNSGDLQRAKSIADLQYIWSKQLKYKKGFRLAFTDYGTYYYHLGNFKRSLDFYLYAYAVAKDMKSDFGMEQNLNNAAVIYRQMGLYDKAIELYNKALLFEKKNDTIRADFAQDERNTLGNMASIYIDLKDYVQGIKYLDMISKVPGADEDSVSKAINLVRYADIYKGQGDTAKAVSGYLQAINIAVLVDYKQLLCDALNDYGGLLMNIKNYKSATDTMQLALKISRSINAVNSEMSSLTSLGELYHVTGNYINSEKSYLQSLALAKEEADIDAQEALAQDLGTLYTSMGRYKDATSQLQNYITLHDSILSRDKQEALTRIQIQYETADKENQIKLLKSGQLLQQQQLKSSNLKSTLLFVAIMFVIVAAFLLFIYIRNRNKTKSLQQTLLLRNKISADLHDDIGSSLSSIVMFSDVASNQIKDKAPQSVALMETISETAHTTMVNMGDIVWSINPDNDAFENILTRMQQFAIALLETKNIRLHFNADEEVFSKSFPMQSRRDFYLLFKEAVNNLAKYSNAKNAWINVHLYKNNLALIIKDDGCGFDVQNKKGNGLKTMRKRAEAISGKLNIQSCENGTTVELNVYIP